MSQFFHIHPDNPQPRLVHRAAEIIAEGGVVAYPTDSSYALGCRLGDKDAMERIRRIRQLDAKHNFTLVCQDLSAIATYAKVDNQAYRLLKSLTPGPYTFILCATHELPRRLQHPKRKTIGLRVPDHVIAQALLAEFHQPMMSTTLELPEASLPETDPEDIRDHLEHQLDLIIDGGHCGVDLTTVVDLSGRAPQLIRAGKGDASAFAA